MFEFTQIGWFDPGSKRFCYTDEKDHFAPRNDDYTHPVFAVDPETASRLTVQLESEKKPTPKEALKETDAPENPTSPPGVYISIYDFKKAALSSKEKIYEYFIKLLRKG